MKKKIWFGSLRATDTYNEWFFVHRPSERSGEDVDIILTRLRELKAFHRFPPPLLLQICACAFYECLEKGITCMCPHTHTHTYTHRHKCNGWGFVSHRLALCRKVQHHNSDDLITWQSCCRKALWCLQCGESECKVEKKEKLQLLICEKLRMWMSLLLNKFLTGWYEGVVSAE